MGCAEFLEHCRRAPDEITEPAILRGRMAVRLRTAANLLDSKFHHEL